MALTEVRLAVHAKNPRLGMPLCWNPKAEILTFEASYFEDDVTCRNCLKLMQE